MGLQHQKCKQHLLAFGSQLKVCCSSGSSAMTLLILNHKQVQPLDIQQAVQSNPKAVQLLVAAAPAADHRRQLHALAKQQTTVLHQAAADEVTPLRHQV